MKMKRMAAGLFAGLLMFSAASVASAAAVETVGEKTFLYLDKNEVQLTEDVKAVNMKDGTIFLMDRNGKRKMGMKNIDNVQGGVGFYVRELRVVGEPRRFWEIFATAGAHDENCGYWLISEENGKWNFELMVEDLVAVGYKPMEWHLMSSKIENGQYILESAVEYMPEGAQFGYEMKILTDWNAEAIWSEKTRSFLLQQLPLG